MCNLNLNSGLGCNIGRKINSAYFLNPKEKGKVYKPVSYTHLLKGDINNIDIKFDKRLCEMKQQSVKLEDNINKRLNEMDECFNTIKEQVIGSVNEQLNNHIINVNKQVSETVKIQVHEQIQEMKDNFESKINKCNVDNEVLLVNANENERECEDSLNEESVQRVEFSRDVVVGEENASLVLLEDKGSSLVFVKDKRSLNFFVYLVKPDVVIMLCLSLIHI